MVVCLGLHFDGVDHVKVCTDVRQNRWQFTVERKVDGNWNSVKWPLVAMYKCPKSTVEPPNKGPMIVSVAERLSSLQRTTI